MVLTKLKINSFKLSLPNNDERIAKLYAYSINKIELLKTFIGPLNADRKVKKTNVTPETKAG